MFSYCNIATDIYFSLVVALENLLWEDASLRCEFQIYLSMNVIFSSLNFHHKATFNFYENFTWEKSNLWCVLRYFILQEYLIMTTRSRFSLLSPVFHIYIYIYIYMRRALRDLVPLVQFKREKPPMPAILLKVTLLREYFSHCLNCTNSTKSRKVSNIYQKKSKP